jgi:C4-dicarboxylate-specific signal transduction histidine kinase
MSQVLYSSMLNPYWCQQDWRSGAHNVQAFVKSRRPGLANLYWLAAVTNPKADVQAVLRMVSEAASINYLGHLLEQWAATGSLELFADSTRHLVMGSKGQWIKDSCRKIEHECTTRNHSKENTAPRRRTPLG